LLVLAGSTALGRLPFLPWLMLAGALAFFCSEYTTHRFLFHARPSTIPWLLRLQHRLHYDHHIDPARLDLLFLPPWFVVPAAGLFYLVYLVVVHDRVRALALLAGSLAALLYYEWTHYVAHTPYVPRTPWGRWIKKYHLWHHFKNEHLWYGVTNPAGDLLARTYRRVDEVERSTTVRDLYPGT